MRRGAPKRRPVHRTGRPFCTDSVQNTAVGIAFVGVFLIFRALHVAVFGPLVDIAHLHILAEIPGVIEDHLIALGPFGQDVVFYGQVQNLIPGADAQMAAVDGDDLSIDRAAVLFGYCIACGALLVAGGGVGAAVIGRRVGVVAAAGREGNKQQRRGGQRQKRFFQMFHAIPSFAIKLYTGSFPGRRENYTGQCKKWFTNDEDRCMLKVYSDRKKGVFTNEILY